MVWVFGARTCFHAGSRVLLFALPEVSASFV